MKLSSSAQGRVAILAFGGRLPRECADLLKSRHELCLLGIKGITERSLISQADGVFHFYDLEGVFSALKRFKAEKIMIVGVMKRPPLPVLIKAFGAFRSVLELKALFGTGDDQLLSGVARLFEERGFQLCGVSSLVPELLTEEGTLTEKTPSDKQKAMGFLGLKCLNALSPFDIGQAAIVSNQRILGIEGVGGTDVLLRSFYPVGWRRLWRPSACLVHGALLVKTSKQGQDMRLDVATIGPRTVRNVAQAGLSGIVLGAGRTLIVDKEETLCEANRRNIVIFGLSEELYMGPSTINKHYAENT
jgi:DUF1009 family protein